MDRHHHLGGIEIVQTGLSTPHLPSLSVGVMRDRVHIQDGPFLDNVATAYRDVFGHGAPVDKTSWGEYLHCEDCGTNRSIEDAYGIQTYAPIASLEEDKNNLTSHECQCGGKMKLFYPPECICREIRSHFTDREDVFGSFLIDEKTQTPYGFKYAWVDTLQGVWNDKFSHFYKGTQLTYERFLEQTEKNTHGELQEDTKVLYLAEIGLMMPSRSPETPFALSGQLLKELPQSVQKLRTLMTMQDGFHSYILARTAGCEDICRVDDSSTIVLSGFPSEMESIYGLPPRDFQRQYGKKIRSVIQECNQRKSH